MRSQRLGDQGVMGRGADSATRLLRMLGLQTVHVVSDEAEERPEEDSDVYGLEFLEEALDKALEEEEEEEAGDESSHRFTIGHNDVIRLLSSGLFFFFFCNSVPTGGALAAVSA